MSESRKLAPDERGKDMTRIDQGDIKKKPCGWLDGAHVLACACVQEGEL